jgi:hypothetical protein
LQHNTFDLNQLEDESWECKSHNLPDCVGTGKTDQEAVADCDRKIMWVIDNQPKRAKANLEHRLKNKLLCMCGEKLEDAPVAVYKGGRAKGFK